MTLPKTYAQLVSVCQQAGQHTLKMALSRYEYWRVRGKSEQTACKLAYQEVKNVARA